jgi:hypothetical protein
MTHPIRVHPCSSVANSPVVLPVKSSHPRKINHVAKTLATYGHLEPVPFPTSTYTPSPFGHLSKQPGHLALPFPSTSITMVPRIIPPTRGNKGKSPNPKEPS